MQELAEYKNRKVLVTGHTGFKGSWMCRVLLRAGAELTGYALEPDRRWPSGLSLFEMSKAAGHMRSFTGDIRDADRLRRVFDASKPEIVIHMAAQSIVRTGYREPLATYETNVMGTANLLECVRCSDSVRSVVVVTTDKVYANAGACEGSGTPCGEGDRLGGRDPYSGSKACAELVTDSWRESYLREAGIPVSAMRAGNAIGGGDLGAGRLIPDCVRAALSGSRIVIRNPGGVRPYQHVLDPVCAYLHAAAKQLEEPSLQGAYNIGPDEEAVTNEELVRRFCLAWDRTGAAPPLTYETGDAGDGEAHMPESAELRISNEKIRRALGWKNRLTLDDAIEETAEFTYGYMHGGDTAAHMDKWTDRYFDDKK